MERNWISYDTNVEVFIALRDVELYYSKRNSSSGRHVSVKHVALKMIAYWRPPGASGWVEKCVTETVFKDRSPSFAVKMHIQCEAKDVHTVPLKFELQDKSFGTGVADKFVNILGSVETSLDILLDARSKGLQLPFCKYNQELEPVDQVSPGLCFLRAEILKPCDEAVLLQFALLLKNPSKCRKVYCLEIYKLNEDGLFQLEQPYTLIHRSEILRDPAHFGVWHRIVVPISRLCNGDWERILKLVVYDPDKIAPISGGTARSGIGFAMTTLRKLITGGVGTDGERRLSLIRAKDGKISQKGCLFISEYSKLHHPTVEHYLSTGLVIRPIYAVDFSRSNWHTRLHGRALHALDGDVAGQSPYEEALEMTANAVETITEGNSIFYSFGGHHLSTPYLSTFSESNILESLMKSYSESLSNAKLAMPDLEDGSQAQASPPNSNRLLGIKYPSPSAPATHLTPLLADLITIVSARQNILEYFTVFIFTDGEITDLEPAMLKLLEVAKLPVSIIFIAVGKGSLEKVLLLQREWKHPTTRQSPCRNISTVIHFRSLLDWNCSAQLHGYMSDPEVLFQKEIMNIIERQLGKCMRSMHPELGN